ncbi:hypothetical protein X765_11405 [Mesorhizobium sp. LSHC440B00]|nr:hypothetical protein X765_11405 [Mesorhizobium sp. LSHC440B00]ESX31055.1 hypothetical protein X764_30775 [Mesorhizobium sp. LSHC440A00]
MAKDAPAVLDQVLALIGQEHVTVHGAVAHGAVMPVGVTRR